MVRFTSLLTSKGHAHNPSQTLAAAKAGAQMLDKNSLSNDLDLGDSPEKIQQYRVEANLAGSQNAYQEINDLLIERRRARVRYKNGVTVPDAAIRNRAELEDKLRKDAERNVRHSRTLARNIRNATGQARDAQADAHHIVAQRAVAAARSRLVLFRWGIGINDWDNGMYLRKFASSEIAGQAKAPPHSEIHTERYHASVRARMLDAEETSESKVRKELRDIKQLIVRGVFTY